MTETIETLRAKLAAAEQERDAERLVAEQALAGNVDPVSVIAAIVHECLSNRRAVAAVRELADRTLTFGGSDIEGWVNLADLRRALATAEQPAPKRHCATLGHEDIPATITGTLWEGEDPDTGIRTAYCDECAQALADDAVFTPDEPKRCEHGSSPHCYPFCVSEPKREQS